MASDSDLIRGLKKIELSDRAFFERAYSSLKMPLADQDFSMIYIWNRLLNVRWAEINGNLCVFSDFEGSTVLWGPIIGGEKLQETVDACFLMLDSLNGKRDGSRLCYLPEELYDKYRNLEGYSVIHQNQDYVYRAKELIELKGGDYSKKRNLIHNFLSSYKSEVEAYDSGKHKEECLELLKLWKNQKEESAAIGKGIRFQFRTELEIAKHTIELADELNLKGIVVKVDKKIAGMAFGTRLNSIMSSIIVEKTNRLFKGISEFIFPEFVKRCWSDCSFVNAQEDMGVEYLKSSKLSWHPSRLIKSYTVVRKA